MSKVSEVAEFEQLEAILNEDPWILVGNGNKWGGFEVIAEEEGYIGRWSQVVHEIVKAPSGDLFRWTWHRGLTEYQDHDFDNLDIRRVNAVEKVITITEYVLL